MPQPLPVTQIFAFREPIVNGREIVVPVQTREGWAGLRADRSVCRALAHDLLAATVAQPVQRGRKPAAQPMIEAAAAGRPLFKTGGRL